MGTCTKIDITHQRAKRPDGIDSITVILLIEYEISHKKPIKRRCLVKEETALLKESPIDELFHRLNKC